MYDQSLKNRWDYESIMSYQKEKAWEEGLKEGFEKGFQQGLKQGLEQALQQGLEQGFERGLEQGIQLERMKIERDKLEAKKEIARNCRNMAISIEDIAKATGLSMEQIADL